MDSFIERVAALQGATPVLIALYDSEDRLRHANPSFQESFQITPEEFPTWADIMRLNHRLQTGVVVRHRDFEGWLLSAQSRRGKLPYRAFEMDMYDGRWFWMTETVQQDGWMLCIASDVTELRQGYRALRQDRDLAVRASQTDELTGTANRRFVFAKLALQVERVGKGLEAPFCLCTLDIDFFKQINDRFGHKCGDAVLRDFVGIAHSVIRRVDFFGRIGGEEFMLVLPRSTVAEGREIVERLLQRVRLSRPLAEFPDFSYSCSAGMTTYRMAESADDVFMRADQALYAAKEKGRDRLLAVTV
ncbi:GGDEF domain-containing protein [Agrobacterium genomosp. 3]|uniref:diguanylate cyclase n=1 Tax=Agrobacterium tumefaciens TaxID=358 RepID=A0AAE6EM99_AGRTU|nr:MULTISPECIES: GGDEF domain-containing protein [Rhizobium/Agrobacterium group]MCA1864238.1 GGDEF domain-containing protein [Agrobacterium tomkonis]KRA68748.1 diguanylate cyclase [Rhizobium sp. Root651]MCA1874591.1 GGDEF domain-containing protein [Agrobacterium tumefaciens]MCA1890506.1 GGDEF domain-containing protein [Agrobacterium tomkonis]MCA2371964.1 GGDEF domain-containing protein [Agrobacterium tomkonis CIP 111-78]